MKTGNTPCGIQIPQDLLNQPDGMQSIRAFVTRAENLNYDSLWVIEGILGRAFPRLREPRVDGVLEVALEAFLHGRRHFACGDDVLDQTGIHGNVLVAFQIVTAPVGRCRRIHSQLLKESNLNFIGNVEGHDLFEQHIDVLFLTEGLLQTRLGLGDFPSMLAARELHRLVAERAVRKLARNALVPVPLPRDGPHASRH